LRRAGFEGPLGIQAYGIGGDPYSSFRRSLAAVRDIERRLDEHPAWADLRDDTL